jgi:glycerol uptake facilitator-like aquaporin
VVDPRSECVSEFLGTYLLVLLGSASVIVAARIFGSANPVASTLFIASVFGGTVAFVVLTLGRASAALINPAVSVGHAAGRAIRPNRLIPYVGFQLLGGVLAGLTLRALFQTADVTGNLGSTSLAAGVHPIAGGLFEFAGTAILSFVTLVASKWAHGSGRQAALVGGTLFLLIALIGPLTGASFNPARSLGPSLASGFFDHQYVYWLGPIPGGLLAGLLFRRMNTVKRP